MTKENKGFESRLDDYCTDSADDSKEVTLMGLLGRLQYKHVEPIAGFQKSVKKIVYPPLKQCEKMFYPPLNKVKIILYPPLPRFFIKSFCQTFWVLNVCIINSLFGRGHSNG